MNYPKRQTLPHSTPSWVQDGAIFFITICTETRANNVLCHREMADHVFDSIGFNCDRGVWWPHLVLLMPDHLHGLFSFAPIPGMKKAIADWKHFISRHNGVVWQRDFFDHRLRSDESYDEKAAYIRNNPVRAGLVQCASDWSYVKEWRMPVKIG